MEWEEALYYYTEAMRRQREVELREVWLAVAFPAFGNKDAPTWTEFKNKYTTKREVEDIKEEDKSVPKMATFKGTDLTTIRR